jgi:6-pyruvoyltetrahydropterin/6-carboxytetrahydropterin synthase
LLSLDAGTHRLYMGSGEGADLRRIPLKLWITLAGGCDPESGFIVNVTEISRVFRQVLAENEVKQQSVPGILRWARGVVESKLLNCKLLRLGVDLNERESVTQGIEDSDMIQVTIKYELAASHRLWNDKWSQQENQDCYGKCGNEAGHGHNYLLEVTLRGKVDAQSGQVMSAEKVDRIVKERVLDRFDHKNLNQDTPEFGRVIPTVENMSKVFWELLIGRFGEAELYRVRLWETGNTYADYFGPGAGPLRYGDTI